MASVPNSISSATSTSTNRVDRQRRDNINSKIQELLTLIPSDFFQEYYKNNSISNASGTSNNNINPTESNCSLQDDNLNIKLKGTGTKDGKPNKGQILTQAVEYITYLQNEVDKKNRAEIDLMLKIQELSKKTGIIINDINLENTSAEIMLAKIGVGPLSESDANSGSNNKNTTYLAGGETKAEYGGYGTYSNP
ncbi:hypothetical protein TBLA_0F00910 [Henningerozyma blattae CBS 6284]|uniref:BHLH domain-containing protein n=1 Tax=Henningerozyma blattae (strain ATCC 34711 / CBS 6284 / DSM 70876 / NBRC 10599 / NRRL Y-10934 / UCD 77-7) TaxID=1071380 RepID=I2H5I3_HENB6|nr:hypothetical protein TBLA_0F00910 [Tetrapisispora blattae CBS 6284]CCH61635.1 hypothetical protein TBLA_0F00910 [Tetrapisispora blattae CBS 6284]